MAQEKGYGEVLGMGLGMGRGILQKIGSSSFDVEFMKPLRPESGPQSGRPW